MKKRFGFIFAVLAALMIFVSVPVYAQATDEILDYEITVEVNEDATLNLYYHIDWQVLESDSVGPLTWMNIGIPNSHVVDSAPLSDTITNLDVDGKYAKVYLDKSYYEGDVASVDFLIVQDYMYQVNKLREGETVYSFTPGWFDDIRVDKLVIRWKNDKASSFSPECFMDDTYNIWETSLAPGDKYTVTMTYPNEAYAFDLSKSDEERTSVGEAILTLVGVIIVIVIILGSLAIPFLILYLIGRGFGEIMKASDTVTKTTRVKVTYYDSCPGCGAPRKEGNKFCEFCGKSLVKSEETITEEQLKKEEKDAMKFTKNGEFHYGSSPNVYIRVNNVRVPNPRSIYNSLGASSSGSHTSSGSHHSSCAHSSCACACACACAGGGRAGCTSKDFYHTNLRLSAIKKATEKSSK